MPVPVRLIKRNLSVRPAAVPIIRLGDEARRIGIDRDVVDAILGNIERGEGPRGRATPSRAGVGELGAGTRTRRRALIV
jgi:hypothetical protein